VNRINNDYPRSVLWAIRTEQIGTRAIIKSRRAVLHCVAGDIWLTVRYYFVHILLKYREVFTSFSMKTGKDRRKEASVEDVSSM